MLPIFSEEICQLKCFTKSLALFHIYIAYFYILHCRSQNSRGRSHSSLLQLQVKEECELKGFRDFAVSLVGDFWVCLHLFALLFSKLLIFTNFL